MINKTQENPVNRMKTDICRDFYLSCKQKTNFKIGMELERLPVYKASNKAVNYFGENGLYRMLRQIAYNDEWQYITDLNFINGLKKGETTITLEPGGQTEYSLTPQDTIFELQKETEKLDKKIIPILNFLGISLLEYPITPVSDGLNIEIIPKRRYQVMAKYMPGKKCYSMMRETAGIQVAVDYANETDAINKLRLSMMISPFATAIFANSPIRCGKYTGYKSYRASAWLETDESRCGLISEKLFDYKDTFSFLDYVNKVFDVPLIFIQRNNNIVEVGSEMSFGEYFEKGFSNMRANRVDYNLHSTLFFPEVRLKNIIEIRNQDCQKGDMKYAVPAFFKGILYNNDASEHTFNLLKHFSYNDFRQLRHDVPKTALSSKIAGKKVSDYAKILLNVSYNGLSRAKTGEEKFLEPIMELVYDGYCPADIILKDWEKSNRRIDKLIESVRLK